MNKKTIMFGALILLLFAVSAASAGNNTIYLNLQDSYVPGGYCNTETVQILLDAEDGVATYQTNITFDPACVNITDVDFTDSPFDVMPRWEHRGDHIMLSSMMLTSTTTGNEILIATLSIHCNCSDCEYCESPIEFTGHKIIADDFGAYKPVEFVNGTITCGTPPSTTAGVVINEFVSDGTEWIELYNAGTEPVNLAGWTLQDTVASHVITLSETIPADGYVVLDCSWLNDAGDTIYLNDTNGNTDDTVAYGDHGDAPNPDDGESAGRNPNGVDTNNDAADFIIFDIPTQGAANGIPVPVCTITSCDSSGVEKDQFAPGENVYVEGSGLEASTSYTIWIQNESVEGGDALNGDEDPSGSQEPVTTDASGNLPRTEIWAISQDEDVTYTEYDIVVDDGDDTYNAASDYIDSATTAGIVAPIPELPTFILTGIGILGLVLLAQRRE